MDITVDNCVPIEKIERSQAFAARCAHWSDLSRLRPLPESPRTLNRAAGKAYGEKGLPQATHAVYGAIRLAVRKGWDGLQVSIWRLAKWLQLGERTISYALARLEKHGLLTRSKQFKTVEAYSSVKNGKTYDRQKDVTAYALGPKAPGRHTRVEPRKKAPARPARPETQQEERRRVKHRSHIRLVNKPRTNEPETVDKTPREPSEWPQPVRTLCATTTLPYVREGDLLKPRADSPIQDEEERDFLPPGGLGALWAKAQAVWRGSPSQDGPADRGNVAAAPSGCGSGWGSASPADKDEVAR